MLVGVVQDILIIGILPPIIATQIVDAVHVPIIIQEPAVWEAIAQIVVSHVAQVHSVAEVIVPEALAEVAECALLVEADTAMVDVDNWIIEELKN